MYDRIQGVSIVAAALLMLVIFEMVRRRRLMERYALVWLGSGIVLLVLAVWRGLLEDLSSAVGIFYPPNALFLIAFGFVLVLLLHFSAAVSKLSDQTKVLAQKLALLEERLERQSGPGAADHGEPAEPAARELSDPRREAAVVRGADVLDR
jgi:hypothetical protein